MFFSGNTEGVLFAKTHPQILKLRPASLLSVSKPMVLAF